MIVGSLPQPTLTESKFSFSDKLRQIKQREIPEIVRNTENQSIMNTYSKHNNNSLMRGMIGDQAPNSILNVIGTNYGDSLKSIS